jgi:class 3 adenylate cyclase/predicted ATPase
MLFCDIVGSTSLSGQLDPEDYGELVARYKRMSAETIEHYNGFVAQFAGDGLLAYFGYPVARENDAERSIRAALELVRNVPLLDTSIRSAEMPQLSSRVGIHTGLVLVAPEKGSGWQVEHSVAGEAVNLTARVQTAAEPNSVYLTRETLDLVEGLFNAEAVGTKVLKGITKPVSLFKITGVSTASHRTQNQLQRGATRLVGRREELACINEVWERVQSRSRLSVVHILGHPGYGKTRLAVEFRELKSRIEVNFISIGCLEIFRTTPLYPIVSLMRSQADLQPEDTEATRLHKIRQLLLRLGSDEIEDLQLMAALLGATGRTDSKSKPIASTPLQLKKRQFRTLILILEKLVRSRPTIIWLDDAHWLDPSSAEFLEEVCAELKSLPLLILITLRASANSPYLPNADLSINLGQLEFDQSVEVANSVPGARTIAPSVIKEVATLSEGVPFFVEQIMISVIDRTSRSSRAQTVSPREVIPLTIAGTLSERLDRFPGARQVMQAAAAFGRSFRVDLLAVVLRRPEDEIRSSLQVLVDEGILRSREKLVYDFSHTLLQRAAYESMIRPLRCDIHARIAQLLLEEDKLLQPAPSELIAHHLTAAEMYQDAVQAWLVAGVDAARKSANLESVAHLEQGLALLKSISDDAVRTRLEINLRAALIPPLVAIKGFAATEVAACCEKGLSLCLSGENSPLVFALLYGQVTWDISAGTMAQTLHHAKLFLELAERSAYEPGKVIGHRLTGMSLFAAGRPVEAYEALTTSVRHYSPDRDEAITYLFGQESRVTTEAVLSLTQFYMGNVKEALDNGFHALEVADQVRHPLSTGIALGYVGGWIFGLCGAMDEVHRQARRLIRLADDHDLRAFRCFGDGFLGWSLCQHGHLEQGIALMLEAISGFDAVGWRLSVPNFLGLLADSMRRAGRYDEALEACLKARQMIEWRGERWFEPERLRIEALIKLEMDPADQISRKLIRQSLACAKQCCCPIFELRALITLRDSFELSQEEARSVHSRIAELSHLPPANHELTSALRARAGRLSTI